MTQVKICGLSREADVEYVNACLPRYAGFVFAESRRRVTPALAKRLAARLDPRVTPVGVFTDAPADMIARLAEDGVIAAAQLHGRESEHYIRALRSQVNIPIIKAFRYGEVYNTAADYILLDGARPGSGECPDRTGAGETDRPTFIAGGLTPENAGDVIRRTRPYALDVSSGVETDGFKDLEKMRAFVAAARRADDEAGEERR